MKAESSIRVLLLDFHGPSVWLGVAFGLGGLLALEWPIHNSGFGGIMFLGGLQLGMGLLQNRYAREAKQSNQAMQADRPPTDRQTVRQENGNE